MTAQGDSEIVETRSKMKAWWLQTFSGYKISSVHRIPKEGSFGSIKYDSVYKLRPKDNGAE